MRSKLACCALLAFVIGCAPEKVSTAAAEHHERRALIEAMERHPSLAGGETRKGSDRELLARAQKGRTAPANAQLRHAH